MSYYGVSGDIRADLNAHMPSSHANYKGENQIAGSLIEQGRLWATSMIDSKLKPRYGDLVPWAAGDVPQMIDQIANCLAKAYVQDQLTPGPSPNENNKFVSRSKHCEELLDQLAEGEMELPEDDDPAGPIIGHTHKGFTPAADVDPVENQGSDPDLLNDIGDRRDH